MDRLRKFIADVLSTYHEFGIVDKEKIEKFLNDNKDGYGIIETSKILVDDRMNMVGTSKSYDEPFPIYQPDRGVGICIKSQAGIIVSSILCGINIFIYRPLKRPLMFSSSFEDDRNAESSSLKKILFFEDEASARLFYEVNKDE